MLWIGHSTLHSWLEMTGILGESEFKKIKHFAWNHYGDSQFLCKQKFKEQFLLWHFLIWEIVFVSWLALQVLTVKSFSEICDFAVNKQNASNDNGDSPFLCKKSITKTNSFMTGFDWRSSLFANGHCKF